MEEKIDQIGKALLKRKETIAVAESVTSGHLQVALSLATNASQFFQGGITAYNVGQKTRHLHVEPIHALQVNGVSEKVAKELALGVCRLFQSDWGIGVTGYAAPLPEQSVTDLYAFYCICFRGQIICSKKINTDLEDDPEEVQKFYVGIILNEFAERLMAKRKSPTA